MLGARQAAPRRRHRDAGQHARLINPTAPLRASQVIMGRAVPAGSLFIRMHIVYRHKLPFPFGQSATGAPTTTRMRLLPTARQLR